MSTLKVKVSELRYWWITRRLENLGWWFAKRLSPMMKIRVIALASDKTGKMNATYYEMHAALSKEL